MSSPVQIASLIVRTRPEHADRTARRLACAAGTEVRAVEMGKIVVVVEASCERALAQWMDAVRGEPDVLMVNLVYHHVEQEEADQG